MGVILPIFPINYSIKYGLSRINNNDRMKNQRFVLMYQRYFYGGFCVAGIGISKTAALKNARENYGGSKLIGKKKYLMANPIVADKYFTTYQMGKTRKGIFTPQNYLDEKRREKVEQQKLRRFDKALGGDVDSFLGLDINEKLLVLFKKFELIGKK